jgi:hypothetical protein
MFRLNVAPISILFALFLPCAAQTPDVPRANAGVKELELSLTSGKPREVAWAAYTIAREKRRQLILLNPQWPPSAGQPITGPIDTVHGN